MIQQMRFAGAMIVMAAAGVLSGGSALGGFDNMVAVSRVPPEVRQTADRAAGNLKWLVAFHFPGKDGGRGFYRLAGRDEAKRRLLEVEVFENGEFCSIRYKLPFSDVPLVATSTLETYVRDFQPKSVEAICVSPGSVSVYVFTGSVGSVSRTIVVRADGSKAVDYKP